MNEYLFSYGTLQKTQTQIQLFGRILHGHRAVLRGYKTAEMEITDTAFLARGENRQQQTLIATNNSRDKVEGTALEITAEELLMADKYEPANYTRQKVKLQSGLEACIYLTS